MLGKGSTKKYKKKERIIRKDTEGKVRKGKY